MDDLLNAAVEAVALEGPEGCSVTSLWTLLEQDLPIGGIAALPAELKQVMWQAILERSSELDFFLPSEEAGGQSSSGPPAQTLVTNTMILRRVDVAEATGASIKAKPHVRDHALGIYDEADICVDPLQRAAVEAVGRSRRTGRLQSDIAKLLGKKAQNFHYVMKHLDTRGLCVRNPLVLNQGGASHHSTTSIVHLPRFAPTLKPGQTFKRDTATGETWVADDDTVKLKAICDVLEACQDQQALQSDLKVKCGFRAPSGHRLWRRLKARLEKSGHISELVVRFNGKSSSCIKLNKPYVIGSVDAEEGAAGEDGAEDEVRGVPEVQAEKTLEHQLLDVILQAGEEGIALVDIASKMGQSSKKMNVRVREVMAAYGMLETSSQQGKQAPPASSGMPAIPAASRQQSTEPNTLALVVAAQPDSGELPMVAGGRALAAVKPQGRRLTTVQGERRLRLVLERLRTEGFLVVRELRRLFATAEAAEGLAAGPPKAPDPATIRRLLERAEAAKQLTVTKVAIPKVANRGEQEEGMRELQVVLPYGGGTTPELLSKIAAASSAINREAYNSASQLEAAGIAVPEVDDIPRLVPPQPPKPASDPGPGHGGHINKRKFDNGYVAARMKRARLLHMLICRLVGLGEWAGMPARPLEAPNTEPRPKDALRQSPSVFIYTAPPDPPQGAARKRGLALLSEHAVDLERDTKYSFLRDELLSAMTVDLFLQVIGSAMVYDGLHDLVAARKTLGDLSDEEKAKFVDSKASERLMVALEGLARQGLLQFVVTPKNAKRAARVRAEHTAAQFITCDTAVLDWPVGLAEGPSERSTGTQRMAFDLTLETQLTDYWARLECMCTSQVHQPQRLEWQALQS
ncbi:hypothetical protein WJX72_005577 [[Myrmecia] bisecta]|uniref:B-block binding subunit of TFIIIC domain-containing protein n=1 Tax=[Myrmecia] bisecta TaxID=41462 RepID=A0AAW1PJ57_9CHLO